MEAKTKNKIKRALGVFNKLIDDFNTYEELEDNFFNLIFCNDWLYSEYASNLYKEIMIFPTDDDEYEKWIDWQITEKKFTQEDFVKNEVEFYVDCIWNTKESVNKVFLFSKDKQINKLIKDCVKTDDPYNEFRRIQNQLLKKAKMIELQDTLSKKPIIKKTINKI